MIAFKEYLPADAGNTAVFGIGTPVFIGVGALVIGVPLMFIWQQLSPRFFRNETLPSLERATSRIRRIPLRSATRSPKGTGWGARCGGTPPRLSVQCEEALDAAVLAMRHDLSGVASDPPPRGSGATSFCVLRPLPQRERRGLLRRLGAVPHAKLAVKG